MSRESAVPEGSRQGRAYERTEIEALLRRALNELLADGTSFREVGVEKLCAQAGIARSTFYLYFADKSAMLESLSAATMLRLYAAQREWLARGAEVTANDVRCGMRALFSLVGQDEAVIRAVAEASIYDPRIRETYLAGIGDYVRAIERFIRSGQKAGWVPDLHPGATASALAWMTERTVSQVAPGSSRHRARAAADALADIVCATLQIGETASH
ncbi:MAG: TetR/AcrR family transcriptional regulator [Sporichthyaceae bacterium]